jgi:hypothetical protein
MSLLPLLRPRSLPHLAALALAFWLGGAASYADLIVKQDAEGGGLHGEMTIQIKGGRARADLVPQLSMLIDGDTGETIFLRHPSKTFTRLTAKESAAFAERVEREQKSSAPSRLEATAERKQINGRMTTLYVWTVGLMKMRFWVALDYPDADRIQKQLDVFQNGGLAGVAASLMPKPGSLPGVRLCTELDFNGQKVIYTITSIREEPVPAETFAIPRGYREGPGPDTAP